MRSRYVFFCAILAALTACPSALDAFIPGEETPWRTTASGTRSRNGIAATLTWSVVPDGASVFDANTFLGPSDLNAYMAETFTGDQSGLNLIDEAFGRWDELSGLSFIYEPNDDGGNTRRRPGVLGVRGDIRIAGAAIDGPGDILAFNYFPSAGGDMVWDTSDNGLDLGETDNNYRTLRNMIMHEIGHGFGMEHVDSDSDRLLLEPFIDTRFDGPQLDDVRAIQHFFGDAYEEDNDGLGNGAINLASDLGSVSIGSPIVIGESANVRTQRISATETDFVSISNDRDIDVYSFTVSEFSSFSAELTPLGGTFTQSSVGGIPTSFNASARVDLSFSILDSDSTVVANIDSNGLGQAETLESIALDPGEYFVRIQGEEDNIQLYMLELETTSFPGDYNFDGFVDAADFTVWRDNLNTPVDPFSLADGNGDGFIGQGDYLVWKDNFGVDYRVVDTVASAVPEPAGNILGLGILFTALFFRRPSRAHSSP